MCVCVRIHSLAMRGWEASDGTLSVAILSGICGLSVSTVESCFVPPKVETAAVAVV